MDKSFEELVHNEIDEDSSNKGDLEDALTDYETVDFEKVSESDLRISDFKDCGACRKTLTIENTYKCRKCGEA